MTLDPRIFSSRHLDQSSILLEVYCSLKMIVSSLHPWMSIENEMVNGENSTGVGEPVLHPGYDRSVIVIHRLLVTYR
jgi:hypothetical protein